MSYIDESQSVISTGVNPDDKLTALRISGSSFLYDTQPPSSKPPLLANKSIDSGWIYTEGFEGLLYVLKADKPSASSSAIMVEFSDDGISGFAAGSGFIYDTPNVQIQRVLVPKGKWTKITFKNGAEAQTSFRFEVKLSTTFIQPTESSLNIPLTDTVLGMVVKAEIELKDDVTNAYGKIKRSGDSLKVKVQNEEPIAVSIIGMESGDAPNGMVTVVNSLNINSLPPVTIANPTEFPSSIEISNFPEQESFPSTIAVTGFPSVQPISDNNSSITVDGSVSISNLPSSQNVVVTSIPAVEINNSDNNPIAVSISNPVPNQTVTVSNFPSTQSVSVTNPTFPITDNGGSITVDGNVSVNTISNYATETGNLATIASKDFSTAAKQNITNSSLFSIDGKLSDNVDGGLNVHITNQPQTQPISGSVSISGNPNVNVSNFPSFQTITGNVGLAAGTNNIGKVIVEPDAANPIPVTLQNTSVSVSNFPTSTSISNFPSTQPISGNVAISGTPTVNIGTAPSIEISNDIGNPLPINGTVAFSNTSINVGNFPSSQPVTLSGTPAVSISNFPPTQQVSVSNSPTVSVSNLSYAEDSVAVDGENLIMAGVVRKDTQSTLVSADGDRTELQVNSSGALRIDGSSVIQPISASSLPLATGASTSALQTTGNTSLASIDSKLTSPLTVSVNNYPTTQAVSLSSIPLATGSATATNQQSEIAALGTISDVAATDYNSNASIISVLKAILRQEIGRSTVATQTQITTNSTTGTQALAANQNRKNVIITNTTSTVVYIYYGAINGSTPARVSTLNSINGYWEMSPDCYTGIISVKSSTGTPLLEIVETT